MESRFLVSLARCLPSRVRINRLRKLVGLLSDSMQWPTVACLLCLLLWALTYSRLEFERSEARKRGIHQASYLVRSYALQVERSIEQIDLILLRLKHEREEWRPRKQPASPVQTLHPGRYPTAHVLQSAFFDAQGKPYGFVGNATPALSHAVADHFIAFRDRFETGLLISGLGQRPQEHPHDVEPSCLGHVAVCFSRSLTDTRGDFIGMVTIAVRPDYLGPLHDRMDLGNADVLAAYDRAGLTLTAWDDAHAAGVSAWVLGPQTPFLREEQGIAQPGADAFRDGRARFVAWKALRGHGLIAVAALSERGIYAEYRKTSTLLRNSAQLGSMVLLALGLVGMVFSAWLRWRKQREEEVRNIFRLAVDGAREGFYMIRPLYAPSGKLADFQIEDCNARGAALAGYAQGDLIGRRFSQLYDADCRQKMFIFLEQGLRNGFQEDEIRVSLESRICAAWIQRKVVRSGDGLAMTIRDVSKTKAQEQALYDLANGDTLTGLPNRYWLMKFLPAAIAQARTANASLALMFIDLDDFKRINDTLGHQAGDELLKCAAQRLKSLVRSSDHVVRLGGDEFTVILEQVGSMDDVTRVADLIVSSIAQPFTLARTGGHRVQASIGISLFPNDGTNELTLLQHADLAMYAAKAAGKGKFKFYEPGMSQTVHQVLPSGVAQPELEQVAS